MVLLLYSPTGVACPIPPIPDEGFVINFGRRYPVILEYYCNNGYVLKGNRTVKCLKNQTWDKEFPACIGKLLLFTYLLGVTVKSRISYYFIIYF